MAETGKTPINHNTETNLPEAECLAGADCAAGTGAVYPTGRAGGSPRADHGGTSGTGNRPTGADPGCRDGSSPAQPQGNSAHGALMLSSFHSDA